MSSKIIYRAFALFLVAFFFSSSHLAAQDAPSVADAARQAREQKQASSKPAQVIDNDTLAPAPSAPTTPTKESGPTSAPAAPENGPTPPAADKPAADSKEEAEKKVKIDALKQEIADKQRSVNLQQREIALAQETYYSNPDHDRDKTGKEKLDSMQSDLKEQQGQLAELQAKLAELAPQANAKSPEPTKP